MLSACAVQRSEGETREVKPVVVERERVIERDSPSNVDVHVHER